MEGVNVAEGVKVWVKVADGRGVLVLVGGKLGV